MDGFKPDRYDYLGATICLIGVAVIMFARPGLTASRSDARARPGPIVAPGPRPHR
ncbi:MAG: hypothetical protein M5T61_20220 [Acidimicrobiia bacterium]|nr:hypothetical protein [Acidimicrobiia bacterium]